MKFSLPVVALACAGAVTAAPAVVVRRNCGGVRPPAGSQTSSALAVSGGAQAVPSHIPTGIAGNFPTYGVSVSASVSASTTGTIKAIGATATASTATTTTISKASGTSSASPVGPTDAPYTGNNPLVPIIGGMLKGGDIKAGLLQIISDVDLAAHLRDISLDLSLVAQAGALIRLDGFIGTVHGLLRDTAFLEALLEINTDGRLSAQLGLLLGDGAFLQVLLGGMADVDIVAAVDAQLGAGFNFGAEAAALLDIDVFIKLVASLLGKGELGVGLNLSALLLDATVVAEIRALVLLDAHFGAGLAALLGDAGFIAHVSGLVSVSADLQAELGLLFSANVGFAAQLEAIIGASVSGKLQALLGAGSFLELTVGFLGGASFDGLCRSLFGGGAVFKGLLSLVLDVDFAAHIAVFLKGLFSADASVGLSLWIGGLFANADLSVGLLGLIGVKVDFAAKVSALLGGKGLFDLTVGFLAGTVAKLGAGVGVGFSVGAGAGIKIGA